MAEAKEELNRRITKIKLNKGTYYFAWEVFQPQRNHWDRHSLACKDLPRPEFLKRLQILANHVTNICEFSEWETKMLITTGVSLTYGKKGNCHLVITAHKVLQHSKAPLIINTPARPAIPENESDSEDFCWSDSLTEDLTNLENEAFMYIDGDRAQQRLDFEGGQKKETPKVTITKEDAEGSMFDDLPQEDGIGA